MIVDRGITCLDELPRSLCFSVCGMEWLKGWQDEALENKKACLALVLMESEEAQAAVEAVELGGDSDYVLDGG